MLFVTADTHGKYYFSKLKAFAKENKDLTKKDYVIIAGDFGGLWNEDTVAEDLAPYERLPFTILFVDGNHENFTLLNQFPVTTWNGGKVHKISANIIHLMRGQVYEIEGKKIFTMGGGTSVDKMYRTEGITWWKEEIPAYADLVEARANLSKHNYEVDYIITHSCDERSLYYPPIVNRSNKRGKTQEENKLFNEYENNVKYKHWYFGHYHVDGSVNERKTVVYEKVLKID